MSIYRPKGSSYYWIQVYVKSDKGLKRIRKSTGTRDPVKAAAVGSIVKASLEFGYQREKISSLLNAVLGQDERERELNPITGTPIESAWDMYTKSQQAIGRPVTRGTTMKRKTHWNALTRWLESHHPNVTYAEEITRSMSIEYAAHLSQRGLKSKTRHEMVASLVTIWKGLMRVSDKLENPWSNALPAVTDDTAIRKPFSAEQQKAILAAAEKAGGDWWLACVVAKNTGMRYGDVACLDWADIDMSERLIRIRPKKTERHGTEVTIPMSEELYSALEDRSPKKGTVMPLQKRHFLIRNHSGIERFSDVLRDAGIDPNRYTFHSWRHTFRTALSDAGVDEEIAMRLGGWSTKQMARHYDHADRIADLRLAIRKISNKEV